MPLRIKIGLVIGVVMFGLGAYIALHPLWSRDPVSQSRFLDLAFATFFLVKGWLYLRQAWRRTDPRGPAAPPGGSQPIGTDTTAVDREGTVPSDRRP